MAGTYNFTIKQGVPFSRSLIWKDSAGNPVDLTGETAVLSAKVRKRDATPILNLTHTTGINLGTTNGTVTIGLTTEQTYDLNFRYAQYDLFIGDYHLVSGEITVSGTTVNE